MSREQIVDAISAAFSSVPCPPPEEIAHCDECYDVWLERFQALPPRWEEISAADIAYESYALTALTPRAYCFLLPAYMAWHVRNFDCSDSGTVRSVIFDLTRTESTDDYILECYRTLTNAQVRAVAEFLGFIAGQTYDSTLANDAREALSSYWSAHAAA